MFIKKDAVGYEDLRNFLNQDTITYDINNVDTPLIYQTGYISNLYINVVSTSQTSMYDLF